MLHFHVFKTFMRALLLPPTGLLILAIAGAILLWLRHRRSGWTLLIAGLALTWLLSMPLVADALTRLVQVYPAFDPQTATTAQAIVILGGATDRIAPEYGGQLAAQLELLERLNYGAWLARLTHLPVLVTSDRDNTFSMVASLRRNFQIDPRWVDGHSYDTFDNARNSAVLLRADHVNSILLVTNSTHMLRSMHEFAATGLEVTAAPVEILSPRERRAYFGLIPTVEGMQCSNRAVYELLGEPVRKLMAALHLRRQAPG